MTHRIQLSTDTRALLSEAFPSGRGGGQPQHRELSRTARAARELLWTSHREELGYCAAARAYLMEWGHGLFEGMGYSAVRHEKYLERAVRYSSAVERQPSNWAGQSLDSRKLFRPVS